MNKSLVQVIALFAILIADRSTLAGDNRQPVPPEPMFEPPLRLKANNAIIDTGAAWGHSSPSVVDLDNDGLRDLILGDFSGKFHYYRNIGTSNAPVYGAGRRLRAGDVDADVRIYCCIGAQARFCDMDGDGIRDMIANSYDPGHCYLFRGLPDGKFAAREELLDKSGTPIRSAPHQKQNHESFGSFFETVDWDGDGDLDLLIGCFDGGLKLRKNEGTAKTPEFAVENIVVEADGVPLKVKAHLCPVVADWDADGAWDIIAGSDDGGVTWFRNTGDKASPLFSGGQVLVEKNPGIGYNLVVWNDAEIVPGIRSQVEVTDYNGDQKLDLIVGDFYTAYDFKTDLSKEQKEEAKRIIAEGSAIGAELGKKMEALREEFKQRYPGDKIYSDEATKEWSKAYQELRQGPEAKLMEKEEKVFVDKLRPFLAATHSSGDSAHDLAKAHGHVWFFRRK